MVENKKEQVIIDILAELILEYMCIQQKNNSEILGYSELLMLLSKNKSETKKSIINFNQIIKWTIFSSCSNHQG